ncbi:MAG: ribosome maturation factor RimM [Caulobacteraceae bacterium]
MSTSPPILVGRVAGGFGIKGEVRITTYTEDPMALTRFRVLLHEDGRPALTIASGRVAKDGLIARVADIADKTQADALRGLRLYVPRSALPPPAEEEFYLADLIGLVAETADGAPMGRVKGVHDFGAGDIIELDPGEGRATVMIPFTREAVPEVRIAEGRVVVSPPTEVE